METSRTKRLHGVFVTEDTADHLLIRLPCFLRGIADLCSQMQIPKLQKALLKWEAMLGSLACSFALQTQWQVIKL